MTAWYFTRLPVTEDKESPVVNSIRKNRQSIVRASWFAALTLGLLGVSAAPAAAAPVFDVELSHDAHEVQEVSITANSGQFRLRYDGDTTSDLDNEASATEVQSALNALPSIGAEGGSVSVDVVTAFPNLSSTAYFVTFDGGPLANSDVPLMTGLDGTVPLGVGAGTVVVRTVDTPGVSRSDERVNYQVDIENTASGTPGVGDELFCNGVEAVSGPSKNWFPGAPGGATHPEYAIEWLRNGVGIPGAGGPPPGGQSYTTTAADEEAVVQCLVTGANSSAASAYVSQPATVVSPQPVISPPVPSDRTANGSRPGVDPSNGTGLRTCTIPSNWEVEGDPFDDPADFTFQWLRNGIVIPGATASTYAPETGSGAADEGKVLQCRVIATNVGGSVVGISNNSTVNTSGFVPNMSAAQNPAVETANSSGGEVTLTVILPAGLNTFALSATGAGWTCEKESPSGVEPAKAVCTRSDALAPGSSYPPVDLAIKLGDDAPPASSVEATVSGGGTVSSVDASHEFVFRPVNPFEIIAFDTSVSDSDGVDYTQAGGHPFSAAASFSLSRKRSLFVPNEQAKYWPTELARRIVTDIPPGFMGNPGAIPQLCSNVGAALTLPTTCPADSIVGGVTLHTTTIAIPSVALFAIEPEIGEPVRFVFVNFGNKGVYSLTPRLRPEDGYAVTIESAPVTKGAPLLDVVDVTLCSFGARSSATTVGATFDGCREKGDADANPKPLLTNQTECASGPPVTKVSADSWEDPGDFKSAAAESPEITGCDVVKFGPRVNLEPTSNRADSPTGLDVDISVPSKGLEDPSDLSQAHLKRAVVTLPKGMSVNPAAADGLAACSQAQLGMTDGVPNAEPVRCPAASKVGSAEVETPLLEERLTGSVYLARQGENPFGTLFGLYLVVESKERGILVKIPGKVEPRPDGQLVSTFDDNPQLPFSSLRLRFNGGSRAPLLNPPRCGTYEIESRLSPWSAADPDDPAPSEVNFQRSTFEVDSGPDGSPCPDGALRPQLRSGLSNPVAGSRSPFALSLKREGGSERFTGLDVALPPGLVASLRGVHYCSDAALVSISGAEGDGRGEISSPTCPQASLVGSVAAGVGSTPFYVGTGKAYLAGPYKGAPLSLAVVFPAVAGPFDLGNVVVRTALYVDARTAQIKATSDPLPTVLHGIPIDVRDIRIDVDRPDFTRAPTSCEPMSVGALVRGERGGSASVANHFQVGDCTSLGFRPRTKLQLFGGIKRTKYQGVRAVVRPRPGDANISRTVVRFPRSAFVAQEHLRNICTRVQFAANACPKASIYGRAVAWSPLLDYPLKGNVYLRSSDNALPDAVADLRGPAHQPIRIEVAVRNDSVNGALRNTVQVAPDAPVSYFRLQMFGGDKGLIVNSRNICRGKNQAMVGMNAHSGRRTIEKVNVFNRRCKKLRRAKRRAEKRNAAQETSSRKGAKRDGAR